jgi:hypothetical protein
MLRKVAAFVSLVIFTSFSIWGIGQLYESIRGYTWPNVSGKIISSVARSRLYRSRNYVSHWAEVRYEYTVDNKRIVGDRIRFIVRGMNEEQTRQIVSAYPSGKSVTVYFDPNDATSAVLEPGIWWPMIPILAFSMTLAFLFAASLYSDVRNGN